MDITLHKLDQIIELLKEIRDNTQFKPLMVRGRIFEDIEPPGGSPRESVAGGTYLPKEQSDDIEMPPNTTYDIPLHAQWSPILTHIIPSICNCTTVLDWHYCPRHGWCK